jgi:hypothetical protein
VPPQQYIECTAIADRRASDKFAIGVRERGRDNGTIAQPRGGIGRVMRAQFGPWPVFAGRKVRSA